MTIKLKIGTRGSKLALTQCGWVQRQIVAAMGDDPADADAIAPLTVITTTGDRIQDRRLIEAGGKALFTTEIEEALLRGDGDIAVGQRGTVVFEGHGTLEVLATAAAPGDTA